VPPILFIMLAVIILATVSAILLPMSGLLRGLWF
jgi:hypothetical protein